MRLKMKNWKIMIQHLDLSSFKFPTLDLLEDHKSGNAEVTNEELISNKNKIVETLRHYKIEITKIRATIGPTITLYEIVPAPGIRIAKIKNLEDDIALSLAALGIRIIAPIPGRGTIGIEVPNQHPEIVSMRSIIKFKKISGNILLNCLLHWEKQFQTKPICSIWQKCRIFWLQVQPDRENRLE